MQNNIQYHKWEFRLLLVAISLAPFYLIFKIAVLDYTPLWLLHGIILIVLFVFLLIKVLIQPSNSHNHLIKSDLDKWMMFIFLYFIWQLLFGVMLGSSIKDVFRLFWQWIVGFFAFFLIKNYLNENRLKLLEKTIITISFIVALFFIIEVVKVNVLGGKSFFWSLRFFEEGIISSYYINKYEGWASLEWGRYKRLGGPLGAYPYTQLFISLSFYFLFFKIIYLRRNWKTKLLFIISAVATLVTFYRTGFVAIIVMLSFYFIIASPDKRKYLIKFGSIIISILLILIITIDENVRILFKTFFWDKLIIDTLFKEVPIYYHGDAPHIISRNFELLGDYISWNPLLIFFGSGFGYHNLSTLNVNSGDLGWTTFFPKVGLFGSFLIFVVLIKLAIIINSINKQVNNNSYYQCLCVASFCYIGQCVLSTFHSGALFHSANYIYFFLLIGLISHIEIITLNNTNGRKTR